MPRNPSVLGFKSKRDSSRSLSRSLPGLEMTAFSYLLQVLQVYFRAAGPGFISGTGGDGRSHERSKTDSAAIPDKAARGNMASE